MTLAERVKASEVFSRMDPADLAAILAAIERGDQQVLKETELILQKEDDVNFLFERSIDNLVESAVKKMSKWSEERSKRHSIEEEEEADRVIESTMAETELESAKI